MGSHILLPSTVSSSEELNMTPEQCADTLTKLQNGLQKYALERDVDTFLVDVTDGLPGLLALTVIKMNLRPGQSLEAYYMPGPTDRPDVISQFENFCHGLKVNFVFFPLKFLHATAKNTYLQKFQIASDAVDFNQVLRTMMIATRAQEVDGLVINPIVADLEDSDLLALAEYINQITPLIPNDLMILPKLEYKKTRFCPIIKIN